MALYPKGLNAPHGMLSQAKSTQCAFCHKEFIDEALPVLPAPRFKAVVKALARDGEWVMLQSGALFHKECYAALCKKQAGDNKW